MPDTEKRNSTHGNAEQPALTHHPTEGVGGRQAPSAPRHRGGGYLDICSSTNFAAPKIDPRLRELTEMGMPAVWLSVAQEIGVDAFLKMWRILDKEQSMLSESESLIEIKMRRYRSYQRYIRNRYVEELFASKLSKREIRERLHQQLGEKTSISNITRVLRKRHG